MDRNWSLAIATSLLTVAMILPSVAFAEDGSGVDPADTAAVAADRAEKLAILEAYVDALVDGNFQNVPMTDDVQFQNPT